MDRPKQIKVGYFTIKIKYCDDLDGLMGDFNSDKMEIRVSTKFSEQQMRETLHHEIMHAVSHDNFPLGDEDEDLKKEEKAVRVISPKMMAVMVENKKLRQYLFEKKKEKEITKEPE